MKSVVITEKFLQGLNNFMFSYDQQTMFDIIDSIVETTVRSGFVQEHELGGDIGFLYDVKRLIKTMPFKERQAQQ